MKVTLDLDKLLGNGQITNEEYGRLERLASGNTQKYLLNTIIVLGVIAVVGSMLIVMQSAMATIGCGVLLMLGGIALSYIAKDRGSLIGKIFLILGALLADGGIIHIAQGKPVGLICACVITLAGAIIAKDRFLSSISMFLLLGTLGAFSGYEHAMYFLCIQHPLLTVVSFGFLAWALYSISRMAIDSYAGVALTAARTCVVIMHMGFWIGSLWGDQMFYPKDMARDFFMESPSVWFFIFGWAAVIFGTAVWGAIKGKPWILNTAVVFGCIHFYTQWFEHLSATPETVVVAGILTIIVAYGLMVYNRRFENLKAA